MDFTFPPPSRSRELDNRGSTFLQSHVPRGLFRDELDTVTKAVVTRAQEARLQQGEEIGSTILNSKLLPL